MRTTSYRPFPVAVLGLLWGLLAVHVAAAEFRQDFRGRPYDPKQFLITGSNTHRVMHSEPEGLRISIPAKHVNKLPVGLVARCGVRGDFEITLAYEILHVETPTEGYGAGVGIYITMVSPTREAATLSRHVRKGGSRGYATHRATTPPGEPRQHGGGLFLLSEAGSGKLRLVRTGPMLFYQMAEGDSNQFREVHNTELGTADLDMVRFAAESGGSPTAVDVYLKWVSIRSDDLGEARATSESDDWLLWLVVGLGVVLLAAGSACFWWYWWRSERVADGSAAPSR